MRPRDSRYRFPIGNLGWPCLPGASLWQASNTGRFKLINCVIFYSPTGASVPNGDFRVDGVYRYQIEQVLESFREHLASSLTPEKVPRLHRVRTILNDRLNLTDIAVHFFTAMSSRTSTQESRFRRQYAPFKFKTVVFLPVHGPTHLLADARGRMFLSSHVGLHSEGGRIYMDSRIVPMPDTFEETVYLYCISALPYRPD